MADGELVVVGIGADGWAGLGEEAREAVRAADVIVGSRRQLDLLPSTRGERRPWPSPIGPLLDELADGPRGTVCVLASGDPMLHGVGATLARRRGRDGLRVIPHPSAFAIACARLGWPESEVELVSAVARAPEVVVRVLQPGRRIVAYVSDAGGADQLAEVLRDRGYGPSRFVVLERLGAREERLTESTAREWDGRPVDALHSVAIECRPAPGAPLHPRTPGLPDGAYGDDGQLTKQAVRAVTLAQLAPAPGALLVDVGAGSGSIGIEWLRAEPTARAIAIEVREDRAERAAANALRLGVPHLDVRCARAPEALDEVDPPDAIFVGGGVTGPDVVDRCWDLLKPGGRIVANAVTLEGEHELLEACARHGGTLTRIAVSHAEPLGAFTSWRAQRPIVQWAARKDEEEGTP